MDVQRHIKNKIYHTYFGMVFVIRQGSKIYDFIMTVFIQSQI